MSDHKIWTWRRHPRNCQNQAWELWIARSLLEKLLGASAWIAVASHNLKITWSPGTKDLTTFLESRKHSQTLWSSQPKILCYFLPLWKISESLFFPTQGEELPEDMGWQKVHSSTFPRCFLNVSFVEVGPEIWGLKLCGRLSEQQTPKKKNPMDLESLTSNRKRSLKQRRHFRVCVWGVYMGPQCITCLPHFGLQMCLCACFPCGRPTAKCGQARNMPLDLIMKICKKPPVFQKQVGSEL